VLYAFAFSGIFTVEGAGMGGSREFFQKLDRGRASGAEVPQWDSERL